MIKPFHVLLALGLAVAFLGSASDASAQAADTKRTLKAWKLFYEEPGMIEADVRYMRGTLMIQGTVPTEEHIKKADELAGELRGIKEVRNRLRVREPEVAAGGDAEIKEKLAKKFAADEELEKALAKGKLEYTVESGHVTLTGKLQDYTVAAGLLNDVRKTVGVRTIDFKKLKY
jgi:osmotically-inducible protein OsmY